MSLKAQLMDDMKAAMKAKEDGKQKLAVIRMVRSAIRQTEIDGQKELDDNDIIALISKEVKMRKDSIDEFKKGGREDLVAQTEAEIAVLMPYLPEQLSEEEVRRWLKKQLLLLMQQLLKIWVKSWDSSCLKLKDALTEKWLIPSSKNY